MKKVKIIFIILVVLLLGFLIISSALKPKKEENTPTPVQVAGKYDAFAICIKEKGAVFYGAFWCPHCNNNKEIFGSSKDLIPYVECSTEDGQGQTQICKDQKIAAYPTWRFADGSEQVGEVTLQVLADKTGCVLPQ